MKGKYTESGYLQFVHFMMNYGIWGFTQKEVLNLVARVMGIPRKKLYEIAPKINTKERVND